METILFQKDLQRYPLNQLRKMARYLDVPTGENKNDLTWLLAIHQAQGSHVLGTMAGKDEDEDQWFKAEVTIPVKVGARNDYILRAVTVDIILNLNFIVPSYALANDIVYFIKEATPEDLQPILDYALEQKLSGKSLSYSTSIIGPIEYDNNAGSITGEVLETDERDSQTLLLQNIKMLGSDERKNIYTLTLAYNPEELGWFYSMVNVPKTKRARMSRRKYRR